MALTDLFRPRWKHSNPEIRREAILELDGKQADALEEAAASDEAITVRLAAVSRIEDLFVLQKLAAQDNELEVLQQIVIKLDCIHVGVALGNADEATRIAVVHQIREEKSLAKLAEKADNSEVRTAAVQRISCEKLLARIARASCGKETAEAAVNRVTDRTLLENVAKKGGNKAARKAATAKLAELNRDRNKPSVQEIRNKELNALTEEAETLSRSYNWLYAADSFAKWTERWETLDCNDQFPDLHKRFNTAATYFQERYKDFQEREAADKAARDELEAALASRKALVDVVASNQGQWGEEADAAINQAEQSWTEIEPFDHRDADVLASQFSAGVKAYRRESVKLAKQSADAEARQAAAEELSTAVEAAAEIEDPKEAKNACGPLRRQLKAVGPAGEDEAVLAITARAEVVIQSLQAKVDAAKEALDAAEKERLAAAEEQCTALEALLEAEDPRTVGKSVKTHTEAFKALGQVPRPLHQRFKRACDAFYDKQRQHRAETKWEEFGNLTGAEELAKKAETLAGNNDMPKVAKMVRELRHLWKENGHLGKEGQEVWKRFNTACTAASERSRAWFAERDAERDENMKKKQALCVRAEQMAESTKWRETAAGFKELQAEWKTIGHVRKDDSDAIWARYRTACDQFFNRLRAFNEERDSARQGNVDAKEALAAQAEELAESNDWRGTADKLKELQRQWKEVGPTPRRNQDQELWQRFHGAADKFFARLAAIKPDNLKAKKELVAEAEALVAEANDENRDSMAGKLMALQRRWKEIGPVPPEESQAVWEAFHIPCDQFFSGRKEEQERNAEVKQGLIASVAEWVDSDDWRDAGSEIKAAQEQWRNVGHAGDAEKELYASFREHCDRFFKRRDANFKKLERNLQEKEEICRRMEALAGMEAEKPDEDDGLSIAEQLQLAFETNFATAGRDERSTKEAERQEVQSMQRKWREIGPVPHKDAKAINQRIRRASDAFFERSRPERPKVSAEEAAENAKRLEELAEKAQALAADEPAEQCDAAKRLIREWREVGLVNNGKLHRQLRDRFDGACDVIFESARERDEAQLH